MLMILLMEVYQVIERAESAKYYQKGIQGVGQGTECVLPMMIAQSSIWQSVWSLCCIWCLCCFQVRSEETKYVQGTVSKFCPDSLIVQNKSPNWDTVYFLFEFFKEQQTALLTRKRNILNFQKGKGSSCPKQTK